MEGYEFTLLSFSLLVFANQSSATNCWLTTPRRLHHPPSGPASPQVDSFSGLLRLLGELVTFVVGLLGELITSHSPHQVIDIPELSGPTMFTKNCHIARKQLGCDRGGLVQIKGFSGIWMKWMGTISSISVREKAYSLGESSKKRWGVGG